MVNKKVVIISTIILIIIVVGIVCLKISTWPTLQYTFTSEVVENEIEDTNTQEDEDNLVEEQNLVETENEVEEENNIETSNTELEEEITESNDDQAIDLAASKWGEDDDSVYYYIEEQISDNEYYISVRDSSTTSTLATYKINISEKTVEEQ